MMTEAQEVAETMTVDLEKIRTWPEAKAVITSQCGAPEDVGYQLHDNLTEALFDRARLARRIRVAAEIRSTF